MPGPVGRWLETFMCKHYADTFETFGYKTLQSVCHLQSPQLQAMGVAQEHCDLILENVFVLRQTLLAGNSKHHSEQQAYNTSVNPASSALRSVAMNSNYQRGNPNHYSEEYHNYGSNGNQMTTSMSFPKPYENQRMGAPMTDSSQRGYSSGYPDNSHLMMQQQHQQQQHHHQQQQHHLQQHQQHHPQQQQQVHPNMVSMYQQSGQNPAYVTQQQQYNNQSQYSNSYMSPNQSHGNMSGNYYNTNSQSVQGQQTPQHHHVRQMQSNTNPQAVADDILQMASSFPSSHTVQVPLNKNRHAPYHVPQPSQHYNMQNINPPSQNQMTMNQHRMYSNTMNSGHQPPSRTSPISPMPMQSPVSHHSNQSMTSPASMHSPSSMGIRSPAQSPGAGMRSPCGMQAMASPHNHGQPMKSPSHIQMGYQPPINSPPHKSANMKSPVHPHHFSPNPMNSPVSQATSPFPPPPSTTNRTVQSPQGSYISTSSSPYVNDSATHEGPVGQLVGTTGPNNPLQSLQKLVMLPETQVVDPKSVVNDACVPSPPSNEVSKNCDSSAEWSQGDCSHSAGSTGQSSPENNRPSSACVDGKHCGKTCDNVSSENIEANVAVVGHKDKICEEFARIEDSNMTLKERNDINQISDVQESNPNDARFVLEKKCHEGSLTNGIPGHESPTFLEAEGQQKLSPPKKKLLTTYNESINDNSEVKCDNPPVSVVNGIITDTSSTENKKDSFTTSASVNEAKDFSADLKVNSKSSPSDKHCDKANDAEAANTKFDDCSSKIRRIRELSPPKLRSIASENNSEDSEEELKVRKDCANTYSRVGRIANSVSSYGSIEKMRNNSDDDSDDEDYSFDVDDMEVEESEESSDIASDDDDEEDHHLEEDLDDEDDLIALREKLNSFSYPDQLVNDQNGSKLLIVHNPSTKSENLNKKSLKGKSPNFKSEISKSPKNTPVTISNKSPTSKLSKSPPVLSGEEKNNKLSPEVLSPGRKNKRNPRNTPPILKREEMPILSLHRSVGTPNNKRKSSVDLKDISIPEKKIKPDNDTIEINDSFDEEDEKPLIKCLVENMEINMVPSTSTPQSDKAIKNEVKCEPAFTEANVSDLFEGKNSLNNSLSSPKKKGRPIGSKNRYKQKNMKNGKKLEKKKKKVDESKESFKNMKFGKTLSLLKSSKKKMDPWQNASPFVRLFGSKSEPTLVKVYESQQQDEEDSKQKKTKGTVSSTVQISNLPSDKSVMVPLSQTLDESNWVCALCGKRSSYKFLGDLFGPYYLDNHVPIVKKKFEDDSKKDNKSKAPKIVPERKRRKSSDRHSMDHADSKPHEVWVHENCTLWSDGVFLIGSKIYGLEEAVKVASSTNCSFCKEAGAMIGCLHKGCSQKYHYMCAAESKCFLDEDNFSLLCVKHKDKRRKALDASTSKT